MAYLTGVFWVIFMVFWGIFMVFWGIFMVFGAYLCLGSSHEL